MIGKGDLNKQLELLQKASIMPMKPNLYGNNIGDGSFAEETDFNSSGDGNYIGYGNYGDGCGYGKGGGYGYGFGFANGYGDGNREIDTLKNAIMLLTSGETVSMDSLEPGKLYLFMTGDGWAWVGRFVRPLGLFGAYFTDNVNVCRTGGTPWPELAKGKGREQATFQSWEKEGYEMPHVIVRSPFPWIGELPT